VLLLDALLAVRNRTQLQDAVDFSLSFDATLPLVSSPAAIASSSKVIRFFE